MRTPKRVWLVVGPGGLDVFERKREAQYFLNELAVDGCRIVQFMPTTVCESTQRK